MKKILALALCAALMLCAGIDVSAAEAGSFDHSHVISDINLSSGSATIELSHANIELDVTGEGESKACHLLVTSDGVPTAELDIAKMDGAYVLHLESATLGSRDYALDLVTVISTAFQNGIDTLVNELQSLDVDEMAGSIVDSLEEMLAGSGESVLQEQAVDTPSPEPMDESTSEEPVELTVPSYGFKGDIASVLAQCVQGPEVVSMSEETYSNGAGVVSLPMGDYEKTGLHFGLDTLCEIMNMIYIDGEPGGLGDAFRETGMDFSIDYDRCGGESARVGEFSLNFSDGKSPAVIGLDYNTLLEGTDSISHFLVSVTGDVEGEYSDVSLGFTASKEAYTGGSFDPGIINADEIVVLNDLGIEDAFDTLAVDLDLWTSDVLASLVAPLMDGTAGVGTSTYVEKS